MINFITILSWSVIGVVVEYDKKHDYIMPDHWWRIVLLVSLKMILIIVQLVFFGLAAKFNLHPTTSALTSSFAQ